ncbi:protein-tyrosine phosphatase-like protein, partial [Ephemerocybe angulata]
RMADEIVPRLYLSDLWTACNPEKMEDLGITHVISVIEHRPALPDSVPIQRRLQVFLADRGDANILVHLGETTKFIADALAENETNKVLVHCQQGISRSATVVCAYICATEGMEGDDAIEYAQARRSIVCPNLGFRLQLTEFSRPFAKEKRKPKTAVVS